MSSETFRGSLLPGELPLLSEGSIVVYWPRERCTNCARKLRLGASGYYDEELDAIYCFPCQLKWREGYEPEQPPSPALLKLRTEFSRPTDTDEPQLDIEADHLRSTIGSLPHDEYLRTIIWKQRRARFVESRGPSPSCELCLQRDQWTGNNRIPIRIQVHHLTYVRKGAEFDEDLCLLCSRCHPVVHQLDNATAKAQKRRLLRSTPEHELEQRIYALIPAT